MYIWHILSHSFPLEPLEMRLIKFILLVSQLYSSGAFFLWNEAPLPCTTNEGEIGECVLHDQCDNNSTIFEDGTGIINPRNLQSTDCPLSTVCCEIPDKLQKHSDHSGELHRNQPVNSREPHRNQPINSREPHWKQQINSREPHWNQPVYSGEPHPNQQVNSVEPHRNQPVNSREPHRNQPINSREPHRNQPINSGEPHRNQPVNSREPHRNQPINSGEPHRNQPVNSREPHRNQQVNSGEPHWNQPVNSGEPHWNQPVYSGEPHRNQPINSGEPHWNQQVNSGEPHQNQPVNSKEPHRNQQVNSGEPHRNQQVNSGEPHRNQQVNSGEPHWNQPVYSGEPHWNQQVNSGEPHRNQPVNSREPHRNQPINSGEPHQNQPVNSREPHRNQQVNSGEPHRNQQVNSGEPHRNQQVNSGEPHRNQPVYSGELHWNQPVYSGELHWNQPVYSGEPHWNQQVNSGEPHQNQPVNSREPHRNQPINSGEPHWNQPINNGEPHRNQPITSRPETTNHPQTSYSEELDRKQPKTWPCTTMNGSPGECVQHYLCDMKTNSVITNGDGIIAVRIDESTDCPLPTVCCKIPDNHQKDSDPQTPNSELNYQNQPKTSHQETTNHPQTLAQKPTNHPQTLAQKPTNHPHTLAQKTTNHPQTLAQKPTNHPHTLAQKPMNHPQTLAQKPTNHPHTLSCTTMDGSPGECVQNYLCDNDTNSVSTDGDGVINVRIIEHTDCPLSTVCCKIPNNNQEHPTHSKELDRNLQKTVDQETMNHPLRSNQEAMNYPKLMFLKETMNHPQTADQEIMNYPQMLDIETMNHPQKSNQEAMNYPQLMFHIETMNHPQTSDQEIMNYPQMLDIEPMNYPQTLSCTTMNGTPGECVQNYLCDIESSRSVEEKNSASTKGCPIRMVCCKVPDMSSRSNLPSQSALYPYIRVPRDTNRSGCGLRNPDGVNVTGAALDSAPEYAKPGEFPWTVAVVNLKGRIDRKAQFDYLGSGALIHERAVLTAAHIFHGASTQTTFYIIIGDYNQRAVNILPRKAIAVQNVEIHNLYDKNLYYDLALVFLRKPVLVSGHVNYICLPPPDYQDPVGTRCISSGWGKNGFDEHQHIMNKAELPVVEHTACQSLLRRVDELGPLYELHPSFMCAGEGGVDSCKGSGGAPLACPMQNEPDRYVLSGVVSWSNNCSLDGIPSVYARVPTVRQWIDDKMAANGYPITSK